MAKCEVTKALRVWCKAEREAIAATYGRSQDPFARGMRRELNAIEGALSAIERGETPKQ